MSNFAFLQISCGIQFLRQTLASFLAKNVLFKATYLTYMRVFVLVRHSNIFCNLLVALRYIASLKSLTAEHWLIYSKNYVIQPRASAVVNRTMQSVYCVAHVICKTMSRYLECSVVEMNNGFVYFQAYVRRRLKWLWQRSNQIQNQQVFPLLRRDNHLLPRDEPSQLRTDRARVTSLQHDSQVDDFF